MASWRKDYNQTPGAESPDFVEQVENVLIGIANDFFSTGTKAGLDEIDAQFRAAFKEVPF